MKPLAIITGVGPGTGAALVRRYAEGGYRVAMLARDVGRLDTLAREVPDSFALPCDVGDPDALHAALDQAAAAGGPVKAIVHNAVGGAFGNFLDVDPAVLEANFRINVMALYHIARWAVPHMEAEGGSILVTGNTSAERGKALFAGFAPTKAAQRILAESIARQLGPKGIHVAYLVIDAVIDVPWTRERFPDKPDDFFIQPADIAAEAFHVAHQPKSAWSFRTEIRPAGEVW